MDYDYNYDKGIALTYENGYIIAQLNIETDVFEQLDGEEMSDGEVEMHCEEMEKLANKYKSYLRDTEHDETYN
jgi:hypothetical protein